METLNNDTFFQTFVEELSDKQVLHINKNKKNVVIRFDLWEYVQKDTEVQVETPIAMTTTIQEEMRLAS